MLIEIREVWLHNTQLTDHLFHLEGSGQSTLTPSLHTHESK